MKKRELLWKSRQKIIKDKIQFWKKVNLLFKRINFTYPKGQDNNR